MIKKRNRAYIRIKKAIFLIYFFLIFEGVLRKWLLPEYSKMIFFLKDPIVLYVYFLAFKYKLFPKTKVFYISMIVIIVYLLISFLQIILNSYSPLVAVYGLRVYFLYLPLPFIIYKVFTKNDISFYIKFTLFISIPIALLVFFQFISPPDAFINKNAGTGEGHVFQIIAGIVRPYGTFSFVIGQSFFVPSILMFLLLSKEFMLKKNKYIIPMAWISFFIMLFLSGSRTTIANSGIIFLTVYIYSLFFIKRRSSLKLFLTSLFILIFALSILNIYFYDIVDIYLIRSHQAEASEGSVILRGLKMLFEFISYISVDMPFLGHGIGSGTSGGMAILTGTRSIPLAEYDLSRIVLELGAIFGLLFILYRVYLTLYIIFGSIKSSILSKNYSSIVVMAFIFPTILFGQLTNNGTVMVYGWFFFGFSLSINKLLRKKND